MGIVKFSIFYLFGCIPTAIAIAAIWSFVIGKVPIVSIFAGICSIFGLYIGIFINYILQASDPKEFIESQTKKDQKHMRDLSLFIIPALASGMFISVIPDIYRLIHSE